jgi:ParB family transcriptional regulator, chromosome partitioning protein
MANKKRALGRGLSALLEHNDTQTHTRIADGVATGRISEIAIEFIEANPFQPRTHFEDEALQELANSIREHGIIQPVTVRKMAENKFQLISGERRFRASQLVGLTHIPAYVRIADDQSMLEMALVENIQRQELDPIEVAISYQRLIDECSLTQEELSQKVAKNRTTVTNALRLLKLPPEIQLALRYRKISGGHARALVNIEDENKQLDILEEILSKDLSVRQTEELARGAKSASAPKKESKKPARLRKLELTFEQEKHVKELTKLLNTKLEVRMNEDGEGLINIPFGSDEDLSRILDILNT